jgi:hypothetical protein
MSSCLIIAKIAKIAAIAKIERPRRFKLPDYPILAMVNLNLLTMSA